MKVPKNLEIHMTLNVDNSDGTVAQVKEVSEAEVGQFFKKAISMLLLALDESSPAKTSIDKFALKITEWEELEHKPRRVQVKNGDSTEEWGLGTYIDDVAVYVLVNSEGTLKTLANPEVELTPEQIPSGYVQRKISSNPKIQLDNPLPGGRTIVYGAQCWWEYV